MTNESQLQDTIYQTLSEYRILTQAIQLNIAKGYKKYGDYTCHQSILDAEAANQVFTAVNKAYAEQLRYIHDMIVDDPDIAKIEIEQAIQKLHKEE